MYHDVSSETFIMCSVYCAACLKHLAILKLSVNISHWLISMDEL